MITLDCCARRLLSLQPDFMAQVCEIQEKIEAASSKHRVLFYPKFHCELNHIEYFWCNSKRYARENCDYTIEGLRENVPAALAHVSNDTILACFKRSFTARVAMDQANGKNLHLTKSHTILVMIDK